MRARTTAVFTAIACGVSATAMAGTWSDLWSTHEQQGQRLLDSNQPGAAAQLFSDPKRRAYAQLRAGQYDKAADLLAPLQDADSQYNRGNALAHSGKLGDALKAYDSALASSPGNKDVMRNRELVAKALEEQQRQQQQGKDSSSGKSGQGQQGQGQENRPNGAGDQKPGDKQPGDKQSGGKDSSAQDGKNGQSDSQGHANAQNQQGQRDQNGQQGQAGNPQQAANQPNASNPASGNQAQPNNPAQNANSSAGSQQQPPNAASAAQSGQRDDQRSAAALQQGQTSSTGTQQAPTNMAESPLIKGGTATDSPNTQPRSEQALALDQWMRSIPEDSGELLRRKFQIEHLMKQQGNQP
jgi:Ca-activated chloride channel homolog